MHLQLSRLSATFLRFCIFMPSECSGVTQIVLLFYFEAIVQREPPGRVRAFCVARLCPKAKILLCCNYLRKLVAFFWMWDGIRVDWRICVRLRSQRHPTQLCIWTSPGRPVLLSPCSCACCSRLFSAVTAFPLVLLATNLLSSLSLCPPAGALWVTGSQRKSVIVLETCHWPRYDGSGTESIVGTPIEYLRPFANEVWQGIHARSHRQAAGRSRQWVSHLDETARSRKSAGYGRPALPHSPQRPPL